MVEEGESERATAARELKENCGFEAERFIATGSYNALPAFLELDEQMLLARGLTLGR